MNSPSNIGHELHTQDHTIAMRKEGKKTEGWKCG